MVRLRTLLGLGVLLLPIAVANASMEPCPAGCGMQTVTCLKTARMAKLNCKADCRANEASTDLGSCIRACVDTFRSARTSYANDRASCAQSCTPPSSADDPSTASCLGACGEDLGTCARNVAATAKTCATGCRTASDRRACLAGCLSAAQTGAAICASDLQACTANCGRSTTTTTPVPPTTTNTMPAPPACGAPIDTACGGTCPNHGDVCQDVTGTCTCMTPTP